jgi:hypothetical protein
VSSKGVVKDMSDGYEMHETFEKEPKFYNGFVVRALVSVVSHIEKI